MALFRTINQKFYGIVGLLVIMFCIAYAEVAYFLSKQSQTASQGQSIVHVERESRNLLSHFYEMRFWARAVFTQEFSDAEQRFGTLMAQLKTQLDSLEQEPIETNIVSRLEIVSELLQQYERNYNHLNQINTEQRIQATRIDSSYQSLASSILSIRQPNLLKPLFVLTQFQMNYIDNRRNSEFQAIQVVIESLKAKLGSARTLDSRLQSYLDRYSSILKEDMALDKEFLSVSRRFNDISANLTDQLSKITREAEILLQNEYKRADQSRDWLNKSLLVSMAVGLLTLLAVITLVAGKIVRPVQSVSQVISDIKSGSMAARVEFAGDQKDEIIQLGLTFNEMLDTLDEKNRQLVEYQEELEITVQELALRESEREALIGELEAKNAELERFTYTVSHDLKSPLITIQGFLGFLEKDALSGNVERMKTDCVRIKNAALKMQQLLNELLELSRIGRIINPPEEVPFGDIVREALDMVSGRIKDGNIWVNIADNLPTIRVDRQRIREVMENLLDNGAKYMGGQTAPRIEIGCRKMNGEDVLYVRDNGIGIDPSYLTRVFGLFEKLDPSVDGTGVGLAIVKRIIEVHGGRIWAESEGSGQGSTFYFTLGHGEQPS